VPTVIAGDFNAWAQEWGSDISKTSSSDAIAKGHVLLEAFATLDVVLLDHGTENTFNRGNVDSVIDLTFIKNSLSPMATWNLGNHYTASDHEALVFSVGNRSRRHLQQSAMRASFQADSLRVPIFVAAMNNLEISGSAQHMATQLSSHVTTACDASMSRKKPFRGTQSATYWWNEEISTARSICLSSRRQYQRARKRNAANWPQLHLCYRAARKSEKGNKGGIGRCRNQTYCLLN